MGKMKGLEIQNTLTETQDVFDKIINKLGTVMERITETEGKSIKVTQTETEEKKEWKKTWKKASNIVE